MKGLKYIGSCLIIALGLLFTGCGESEESAESTEKQEHLVDGTPVQTTEQTITGQFIDAPVKGLKYNCSSELNGETNQNGEYTCKIGDDVTFYINNSSIGTVAAQAEPITPYTLFPDNTDTAINLARVLQTLDDDTIDGVINISKAQEQLLPQNIDFSAASFETTVEVALGKSLIGEEQAKSNMNTALTAIGGYVPSHYNSAPVANAGADQNVHTTNTVTLDGSNSSDADFDTLTYSWSITSKPEGSNATLSDATVAKPTFVADIDGSYIFSLVVNDGEINSAVDSVTVVAMTANAAPVANAGADQNVHTTNTVTLDGSNSSDADFDTLTYSWSITSKPEGSNATLSDATVAKPTFVADIDGSYVIQLVVNDGAIDSAVDTATITAIAPSIFIVGTDTELRYALLNAANNGKDDTIILSEGNYSTTEFGRGTYKFTSTESNQLILQGVNKEKVILDGDATDTVLTLDSPKGTIILKNLTITNGYGSPGGVYTTGNIELDSCIVSQNNATKVYYELDGGGLYAGANILIKNTIFKENYGNESGGGFYSTNGNVTIENSQFLNNSVSSSFKDYQCNYSCRYVYGSARGGAFATSSYNEDDYFVDINNSYFEGNYATESYINRSQGGAVYTEYDIKIENTIFKENATDQGVSYGHGGALYLGNNKLIIINSLFDENLARTGSAIYYGGISSYDSDDENITILNSMFANETDAIKIRTNIYDDNYPTIQVLNSIFLNNTKNIDCNGDYVLYNNYIDIFKNETFPSQYSGNIYENVNLGFVDESNKDYHLTNTSDLIDAGKNEHYEVVMPVGDLDGNPRQTGANIDIGPYEYQ